jgi:hypothetical protein
MKDIIIISLILNILILSACNQPVKQADEAVKEDTRVLQAPYDARFYDSLQITMDTYYELTDGMTTGSITYADKWAGLLKQHIDSLPIHLLQMDSSRLEQMKMNAGSISAELTGLQGEKTIDQKREAFGMVSDMMYDLVRATGLRGKTIYRQYCPMALNDKGGYWMSKTNKKQNPYFGNEMLGCVEVTDSLRY